MNEIPNVNITGYVHIMKPVLPQIGRIHGPKPDPKSLYISRGPFKFHSHDSYKNFLSTLASVLPCPIANLVLDKTDWKPQTPANRPPLLLGGDIGYSVLRTQMAERVKDCIVIISMPGPRKPADNVPVSFYIYICGQLLTSFRPSHSTTSTPSVGFDFDELEATSAEDSVAQQKVTFDKAVGPKVDELKERWPVNDRRMHIYTDGKRFQWEITPIRFNIWAAHWVRGNATIDNAPASAQFDIKYRLKTPAHIPTSVRNEAVALPTAPQAPTPSSASEKLLEMLAISMLQQQQQQQHQTQPQPLSLPLPPHSRPRLPIPAPFCRLPGLQKSPAIEFCESYGIKEEPMERLRKPEYEPGDEGILLLKREDWETYAGFAKLGWDKVLGRHCRFMADVQVCGRNFCLALLFVVSSSFETP
ncbi:hypothetical protein DFH07DRAFT_763049 [Mycena maculata]|uniref:Uncharacterized protein n=1 Tax=Mycena maculata TaxID=230809 RepID=A0AAD7H8W1_9AGAR|nr:hypothetical protein DFH07DRAFT_763049 [Mycena maculata]